MSAIGTGRARRRAWTQLTWNQRAAGGRAAGGRAPGADGGEPRDEIDQLALGKGEGWTIVSYLIAGIIAYGGLGWLIGHFTRVPLLFPAGMLTGLAISLGWIVYRYGVKS